ncbi:MAG TPA: trypsin-like serine protease [Phycisphaerae bacterium]|nr:trypsin-like serine protease [Phycisphaerae bacterium]
MEDLRSRIARKTSRMVVLIVAAVILAAPAAAPAASVVEVDPGTLDLQKLVVAGAPPDSPAARVDSNTTTSIFAGVGSVFADLGGGSGYMGSGALVHGFTPGKEGVRNFIVTAAHVVDTNNDGIADFAPSAVSFILNAGSNFSQEIVGKSITIHPNYSGFNNPVLNDDIAVIELTANAALGIPIYNLSTVSSGVAEVITSAGYGKSGNAIAGYTIDASLSVKRVGKNQRDAVGYDDEGSGAYEVFYADFDGPTPSTNVFNIGSSGFSAGIEGTLGNAVETMIGPGDSGGPSFLSDWDTHEPLVGTDGNLILLGINNFSATWIAAAPHFGSIYGGMYIPAYAAWIDSVVPEPATLALVALGGAAILIRRRK